MKYLTFVLTLLLAISSCSNQKSNVKKISISYCGIYFRPVILHISDSLDILNEPKYEDFEDSLHNPIIYLDNEQLVKLQDSILHSYEIPSEQVKIRDSGYMICIENEKSIDTLYYFELANFRQTKESVISLSLNDPSFQMIAEYFEGVKEKNFRY